MKKKLLFGILLISIFLFSSVTMVQPARGYEFGVPDQAKGMEGEGEIKIFDKDEWKKSLGGDGDRPDDIWDGDSDIVGAKSKSKIKDWEEDEDLIHFFWDFILATDLDIDNPVTGAPVTTVSNYKDAIKFIDDMVTVDMGTKALGGTATIITMINNGYFAGFGISMNSSWLELGYYANNTAANFQQGTLEEAQAKVLYDKKYDGTLVEMDTWEFLEKGNFKSKPDEKGAEAPFLADPRDLRENYDLLVALKTNIYTDLFAYAANGTNLWGAIMPAAFLGMGNPWMATELDQLLRWDPLAPGVLPTADPYLTAAQTALGAGAQGPIIIYDAFEELIPKKAGFLYMALEGGLPCYVPTEDYLTKMVAEFNINDEFIETGHPAMEGSIPFTADVKVEGMTITMKFDFDDYLDPADWEIDKDLLVADEDPDELENWKVVFTYSEYGSQSKVQYMDGDDIFFEKGGVDQIPGYEVAILIGVSALSVLGLIYVVMKKRKM